MKRGLKKKTIVITTLVLLSGIITINLNNNYTYAKTETINVEAKTYLTENNEEGLMYKNSDFIEKEQPTLTEETKKLISNYQKDPSMDNYLKLRDEVIKNYNAVLDRKEQKLAELIEETNGKPNGDELVAEMQEIVQEMYITYWNRINSSMLRFTDSRLLKWKIAEASKYEYIPVMGAGDSIYVKRTPVTNKEYAEFIKATGHSSPQNWTNGTYPSGEDDYPVNYVSYNDAVEYANWLTKKDGTNTYRLPSETEWELAAGHMPKDADFNNHVADGRVSVNEYATKTRGAHGAVDFWGNVWEWTSTVRETSNGVNTLGVKGGSWKSARTDCRTEHRKEARDESIGYDDVGFRVIQVLNGKEPDQKTDLYTLDAPNVSAKNENGKTVVSWNKVKDAVEYQIFEYNEEKKLFKMLDRVTDTSYTVNNAPSNTKYIVQALSYTAISDNVNPDGINQIKNDNTNTTENNVQKESNNNYIYYVIGGIGIIAIIGGLIIILKKNKQVINESESNPNE